MPTVEGTAADGVTRDEAARILGCHVGTVDRLIRRGVLSRARLRAKLAVHFSRPAPEDSEWLSANGYDALGRLLASTGPDREQN